MGVAHDARRAVCMTNGARCFVTVGRRLGGPDDWHLLDRTRRRALAQLGALYESTERDRSSHGCKWRDTFRVPLVAGRCVQDVQAVLASRHIDEAEVSFGAGREGKASGSGEDGLRLIRMRQRVEQRRYSDKQERDGCPAMLLSALLGENWRTVLASLPAKVEGDYPPSWPFAPRAWLTLCQRFHWLPTLWHAIDTQLATNATPEGAARAYLLQTWCADQARDDGAIASDDHWSAEHAPALDALGQTALGNARASLNAKLRDSDQRARERAAEQELNRRERAGGLFLG